MSETEGTRTFSIELPANVLGVLEELLRSIPKSGRAKAQIRLQREVMLGILRFHRDEGLKMMGAWPSGQSHAKPFLTVVGRED